MQVSIDGMIYNFKNQSMAGVIDKDGKLMSDKEAREFLKECKAKGWKYLPTGDCEGFDHFENGCPGHPIDEGKEVANG